MRHFPSSITRQVARRPGGSSRLFRHRQPVQSTGFIFTFEDGRWQLMLVAAWLHHLPATRRGTGKYINLARSDAIDRQLRYSGA